MARLLGVLGPGTVAEYLLSCQVNAGQQAVVLRILCVLMVIWWGWVVDLVTVHGTSCFERDVGKDRLSACKGELPARDQIIVTHLGPVLSMDA